MQKLTFEQARVGLGLEPFESFTNPYADVEGRCSGRTTAMLIRAVIKSQEVPVVIYGYSLHFSTVLTRNARQYAEKLGLDPAQILNPLALRHRAVVVFIDHYDMAKAERSSLRYNKSGTRDEVQI